MDPSACVEAVPLPPHSPPHDVGVIHRLRGLADAAGAEAEREGNALVGAAEFALRHSMEQHTSGCPYCGSVDGFRTRGTTVDRLGVSEFLTLLNAGWRRFGRYLWYQDDAICCRQLPIRVDVKRHAPNRDNRKTWKKLEKHLRRGGKPAEPTPPAPAPAPQTKGTRKNKQVRRGCFSCGKQMVHLVKMLPEGYSRPACDVCHGCDLDTGNEGYLHCPTCLIDTHVGCECSSFASQIIDSITEGALWRYHGSKTLEVRIVAPNFSDEKFALFMKYQRVVHGEEDGVLGVLRIAGGEDESVTDAEMFRKYLVESPLFYDGRGGEFQGTFHFEYRLDGRLFMTTVTDLLRDSVNSVYCFYDPDDKALMPGKLSILFEMEWMRKQSAYQKFGYYYLGMYLDSPKMAYKANYYPAELLCLAQGKWAPFEDLVQRDTKQG